jgi:hypothetical protein
MTNETKQNSIDWLIDIHFGGIENVTPDFKKHIDQAKEMHRKELELAYQDGKEIEHIQNTIEKNKHKHTNI